MTAGAVRSERRSPVRTRAAHRAAARLPGYAQSVRARTRSCRRSSIRLSTSDLARPPGRRVTARSAKWTADLHRDERREAHAEQQAAVCCYTLANANSTGFRAELHKLRAVRCRRRARDACVRRRASVATNFDAGAAADRRALDVAVEGKGWLAFQLPYGSEGLPATAVRLSANGVLQTEERLRCSATAARSRSARQRDLVGKDGTISAMLAGGEQNVVKQPRQAEARESPKRCSCAARTACSGCASAVSAVDDALQVAGGSRSSNVNGVDQLSR